MRRTNTLKQIGSLFKLIGKVSPQTLIFMLLQAMFSAINTVLTIYFPKLVIDLITAKASMSMVLENLLLFFIIKFLVYYLLELINERSEQENDLFHMRLDIHYAEKINSISYEYLESPEILRLKEAAEAPMNFGVVYNIIRNIANTIRSVFTIVAIVYILVTFSVLLFAVVTAIAILSIIVEARVSKENINMQQRLVDINKEYNYYMGQIFREDRQKEFRFYKNNEIILSKTSRNNKDIENEIHNMQVIAANGQSMSGFLNSLSSFLIYSYAGLRLVGLIGPSISLGNFSILIGANQNYSVSIRTFALSAFEIYQSLAIIQPIFDFLDLKEIDYKNEDTEEIEPFESLEFRDVSFSYPGSDRLVLDGVSFRIDKGQSVALVGRNNSGKSTIVKLICRLFEPTSGQILWNGKEIRELPYNAYMKELSAVFQDFKLFPISLWKNISLQEDFDKGSREKIMGILEEIQMDKKVNSLELGLNTKLDKTINEDAVQFSGGEMQKLAIARAVYRDSSLAILDEPTAALDPLAEAEIYGHYKRLIRGKTSIFISHRMSASKFCDRILVLENGKISGDGSHKQMLEENNMYRDLYLAQAQYYS